MTEDFALVWKRICDNQGNKFLTIRKESFEYKIEDECFISSLVGNLQKKRKSLKF